MKPNQRLAIIGGGPIGLEAAVRGVDAGFRVTLYESGDVAENVRAWGHVTLFSPFSMNHSTLGAKLIRGDAGRGDLPQGDACLTGREFVKRYLVPLGEVLSQRARVLMHTKVLAVGREHLFKHDLIGEDSRADVPFRLLIEDSTGGQRIEQADIVIDSSGTYGCHNWMGAGGIPAPGEAAAAATIAYQLEDIAGAHRARYASKRVLLVGAGYSAATSAVALCEVQSACPDTRLFWLTCGDQVRPIHQIDGDPLPERRRLSVLANTLATDPSSGIEHHPGLSIQAVERNSDGSVLVTTHDTRGVEKRFAVDRIVANVGYLPDRSLYRELQIHECYATMGPIKLAATLLEQDVADCLEQQSPGVEVLINPEPNFFILGSKSYGRNSTFLIRVGLEQIDQVFTSLVSRIDPRKRND